MQFLDEFHLKFLHLHHLFFLLSAEVVLTINRFLLSSLDLSVAPLAILFNLHRSKSLLLVHYLILHTVLLFHLEIIELFLLIVLLFDYLGLFALLAARLEDRLLDLALLILALPVQVVVVIGDHALILILDLVVIYFLKCKHKYARL